MLDDYPSLRNKKICYYFAFYCSTVKIITHCITLCRHKRVFVDEWRVQSTLQKYTRLLPVHLW